MSATSSPGAGQIAIPKVGVADSPISNGVGDAVSDAVGVMMSLVGVDVCGCVIGNGVDGAVVYDEV